MSKDEDGITLGVYDDVYNSPEKFGLTIVGVAEDDNLSYEFDMFVVWRDSAGNFYCAYDIGCSCPSPFEGFRSVESLGGPKTVAQVHADLDAWAGDDSSYRRINGSAAKLHATLADL